MSQSVPINPHLGNPKAPWDEGGHNRGPIICPPAIGEIGGPSRQRFSPRNKAGNQVMRVGKK